MSYPKTVSQVPKFDFDVPLPRSSARVEFRDQSDPERRGLAERASGPFTVTFLAEGANPKHLATFGPFGTHAEAKAFMTGARGQAFAVSRGATRCFIDQVVTGVVSSAIGAARYLVVSTVTRGGKIASRHAYGFFASWEEADDFSWNRLPGEPFGPGQELLVVAVEPPPS